MKINVSSAYANPNAALIQKSQEIVQQIKENLPNKSTGNYPIIDRVDVRGEAECIILTIDNKKVQLNYLHHKQAVSVKVIDEDGRSIELKQENIPLEIKNLKDPKAFNAFTKNVYAKVSTLSDGNYKIDINHRILGGMGKSKPTTSSEDQKKLLWKVVRSLKMAKKRLIVLPSL